MLFTLGMFRFFLSLIIWILKNKKLVKEILLNGAIMNFIFSLWVLNSYLKFNFKMGVLNMYFNKFMDLFWIEGIGLLLVVLTCLLMVLCIVSSWTLYSNIWKFWGFYLLLLESILIFIFMIDNMMLFYVLFEMTLIPMFIIILILGSSKMKISASYQLFLYTMFSGLGMLISMFVLISNMGSASICFLYLHNLNRIMQDFLWLIMAFTLSVKIRLFRFHSWLPQAHVQARTEGSMILAGILLKLGGFGFIKLLFPVLILSSIKFSPLMLAICMMGTMYTSLSTLKQLDLKKIMAYASIGHMSMSIASLFSNSMYGFIGSLLLWLGHGFVSAGLFFLVGSLYNSFHTKNIKYLGGLVSFMRFFSVMFFLFSLANISVPGTMTFVAETLMFLGLIYSSFFSGMFMALIMILGAGYTIWIVNSLLFGLNFKGLYLITDLTLKELVMSFMLIFPVILFGFNRMGLINSFLYSSSLIFFLI